MPVPASRSPRVAPPAPPPGQGSPSATSSSSKSSKTAPPPARHLQRHLGDRQPRRHSLEPHRPGDRPAVRAPIAAKQHLRVGRATSTTCSVTVATTGDDLYYRLYVFRDVNSGTALTDILENGTAGTIANGVRRYSHIIADTGCHYYGADRLALQLRRRRRRQRARRRSARRRLPAAAGSRLSPEFASATGTDGCDPAADSASTPSWTT